MGPYEMFPSRFSTITGSETGCGGCNYSFSFDVDRVRNQLSGVITGVVPYSTTSPGVNQIRYNMPLYQFRQYPQAWPQLLSGAVEVTYRGFGSSGQCVTTTGGFFYPTGSGQICYESGVGCDDIAPCRVSTESVSIKINPSLYGPSFPASIPTGIWVITLINYGTSVTGAAAFQSWVLTNNTGTTGFTYNSEYSQQSGVTYTAPTTQTINCAETSRIVIDIDYYVNGLGYLSGNWLGYGTYHVPTMYLGRSCTPCTGI